MNPRRRAFPRWGVLVTASFALGCGDDAPPGGGGAPPGEAEAGSSVTAQLLESPPPQQPRVRVTDLGHDEGDPEARVRVVEFSDYGCGYCRKFHLETLPTLRNEFIVKGKVVWKTIPFVTGMFSNSRRATAAAECAARQDRFQAMSHRLFQDQGTWKPSGDPGPHFREYAEGIGLSLERFDRCLKEDLEEERIERATRAADRIGIRATPTFFIDGYPVQGAIPLDLFRRVLEARLADTGSSKP